MKDFSWLPFTLLIGSNLFLLYRLHVNVRAFDKAMVGMAKKHYESIKKMSNINETLIQTIITLKKRLKDENNNSN